MIPCERLLLLCLTGLWCIPLEKAEFDVKISMRVKDGDSKPGTEPGFDSDELEDFVTPCTDFEEQSCGVKFLEEFDRVFTRNSYFGAKLSFAFETDLANATLKQQVIELGFQEAEISRKTRHIAEKFKYKEFSSYSVRRKFMLLTETTALEDNAKRKELIETSADLTSRYGNARACPKTMPCLAPGEYAVETFMREERDYDKLEDVWKAWQDATSESLVSTYTRHLELENEGARLHGYKDAAYADWFLDIRENDFDSQVLHLFNQIKPLYQQMHAYVRHKLLQHYPGRFKPNDPIPAHILGNPWSQQWTHISDIVHPYSREKSINPSIDLSHHNATSMMKMAEDFFLSLGLPAMTPEFWKKSVLTQIPGKVMQCHASAADIGNKLDYRIKMCTDLNADNLFTMHHEMGHIEYYMQYSHLPKPFRGGANEGFHEAIGDTISLSVSTPEHLHAKKFLSTIPKDEKYDINVLFNTALAKVVFLPFSLVCDVWRWRVFNGTTPRDKFNEEWWKLRVELQGIMPSNPRPKRNVDAMSKYHIAVGTSYIRYFISFLMQFQFYEAMCKESGHTGALHRCDFYRSKKAGHKLSKMLQMGASRPWQDAMEAMTGQRKLKTDSLLRYFRPLHKWLEKENKRLGNPIGWHIPPNLVV